jgi:trigger factor
MRTSAETLEGNKVKLVVEVDEEEIGKAEEDALRRLTLEARLPGFRPGKVPRKVIQARLGAKGLREEVLRESLPEYFADAVEGESLDIIAPPDIDITSGEDGGPIVFSAIVEIRPEVSIAGYEGLLVTISRPEATPEEVDVQLDRMRDQFATLTEVDRPARTGDVVTLDVQGTRDGAPAEGLSADDLVYEVGKGGIVDGMDERLVGAKVGDIFEMDAEDTPDGPAHLRTLVKLVREKVLPEADDAFASDASEFETIAELRADLETRISNVRRYQASIELRDRAVDALIALVSDLPPDTLVDEEANRLIQDIILRLSQQRMSLEDYLQATDQDYQYFLDSLKDQAVGGVKADLALRALARELELEPDESEVDEEIVHLAGHAGQTPGQFRELLESNGRMPGLRVEIRKQKAMAWLVDHVAIVDEAGNPVDRAALRDDVLLGTHDHDHEDSDDESDAGLDETSPYSEER